MKCCTLMPKDMRLEVAGKKTEYRIMNDKFWIDKRNP